jgi:hypothetical protein
MRPIVAGLMLVLLAGPGCATAGRPSPAGAGLAPVGVALAPGESCTVFLKRDWLGGTAPVPIGPLVSNFNGADLTVGGKLLLADADWIVLVGGRGEQLWIPRPNVLIVKVEPQEPPESPSPRAETPGMFFVPRKAAGGGSGR